jgi:hypothetical protein
MDDFRAVLEISDNEELRQLARNALISLGVQP